MDILINMNILVLFTLGILFVLIGFIIIFFLRERRASGISERLSEFAGRIEKRIETVYENLRLDVALPKKVQIEHEFDLAVAVKMSSEKILKEVGLQKHSSGIVEVRWTQQEERKRLKVVVAASHCTIYRNAINFYLHRGTSSLPLYFRITPHETGRINIVVSLFQGSLLIGSIRTFTKSTHTNEETVQSKTASTSFVKGLRMSTPPTNKNEGALLRQTKINHVGEHVSNSIESHFSIEIFEEALEKILPLVDRRIIQQFARLIVGTLENRSTHATLHTELTSINTGSLLQLIAGEEIKTSECEVYFGDNNQFGDVSIRDIVRGNVINMHFHVDHNE